MAEGVGTDATLLNASLLLAALRTHRTAPPLYAIGSVAVAVLAPDHLHLWRAMGRKAVLDIDLVGRRRDASKILKLLLSLGYIEDDVLSTKARMEGKLLVFAREGSPAVEVFFDPLIFHHTVAFGRDLRSGRHVADLGELLLLKLQREDHHQQGCHRQRLPLVRDQAIDLAVLLAANPLARHADAVRRVVMATRSNWPFWGTALRNLRRVTILAREPALAAHRASIEQSIALLWREMRVADKPMRWKAQRAVHKTFPCLPEGRTVEQPTLVSSGDMA